MAKLSDVASCLHGAGFDEATMTRVLKALMAGKLVDLENKTPADALHASAGGGHPRLKTPAEAAENDQALPLLRQLNHAMRRHNLSAFKNGDAYVDIAVLEREMSDSKLSTEERIRIKTQMAMVNLLV